MNSKAVAVALRALADAFEEQAVDPAGNQAVAPVAEPVKRGRGRPVKGEDPTLSAAATAAATQTILRAAFDASTSSATMPPAAADPFDSAPVPTATLDEVRASLKALAAAIGQDDALALLKRIGGASNITDLSPEKYGQVKQAADKALPPIKTEPEKTADPFETAAATPAKALTIEDVKAVIVEAQKRTSQDTVQKVVMSFGGKAALSTGGEGPSLKALPADKFEATIAALKALPATK